MMKRRIYLSSPHMSGREMYYINLAFSQNWIAPLGPNVDALEKELADYCNVKDVAVLNSGTAALHLALVLLGVGRGDEVLVSSMTFAASVNPIIYQGATPILIDCEEDTWNMNPELLEKAILQRRSDKRAGELKAIILVHLYGMPAEMDEIMSVANKYNIPVVEDAAEALGSLYKGKQLGTFGKMGVLSFNGNKIITTSGGGALISDDTELISKARFLSTQARDPAPYYQHSQIGYNYRMSNVLAGIGRGQLEVLDERIERKRKVYSFYYENLKQFKGIRFHEEPDDSYYSNRWLTAITINPELALLDREVIRKALEKANIESRPLWKPMHLQPVYEHFPSFTDGTSDRLFNTGLCLPSGTNMKNEDCKLILHHISKQLYKVKQLDHSVH